MQPEQALLGSLHPQALSGGAVVGNFYADGMVSAEQYKRVEGDNNLGTSMDTLQTGVSGALVVGGAVKWL